MSLSVDWNSVFVPAIGLAEIVVRGSIMYLGLFVIMRFMARRQAGHFGPADLLVIVLIADAAQPSLSERVRMALEHEAALTRARTFGDDDDRKMPPHGFPLADFFADSL